MMHSCMEWKEGCVHHTTRCLFTFRELFSRTFVALEILKNSDKQRIWPHYLWIKDEIRKNSYKHNQAQRNLIHDVASIVSMLFYFVFGQARKKSLVPRVSSKLNSGPCCKMCKQSTAGMSHTMMLSLAFWYEPYPLCLLFGRFGTD